MSKKKKLAPPSYGEVCFSLRYVIPKRKLTVSVVEAKNLMAMDKSGTSDPYVKVSLIAFQKTIAKKKTRVIKETLNPFFNKTLVFDIPFDQINEVTMLITVMEWNKLRNKPIGEVVLSHDVTGSGREHWKDMFAHPQKPVVMWHQLSAPDLSKS
ncbi:synaptotagmin-5-like [Anneissia japonica]|uniref:synaptotagmin-5-like n=1 Tax=Anneissia japonica TaxID=1529436 RepID=UPI0014259F5A|nr:synaptotagmin-5-like [Anneissia japonica]XP_033102080.1 synaptotagmin-5-like [Anneissia japonica]XP_033102081.1 synaptotagmin-5-like [Anneissia japonica]XP_033102082.1 synaptotagmin-5-like [Anneissia japonica]